MYLEWMKKHFVIVSILLFLSLFFVFVLKRELLLELLGLSIISSLFFGIIEFLLCRFMYRETTSIKMNLILLMWDIFLLISLIGSFMNSHTYNPFVRALIVIFFIRNELVCFSKIYHIKGK